MFIRLFGFLIFWEGKQKIFLDGLVPYALYFHRDSGQFTDHRLFTGHITLGYYIWFY